MWCEVMLEIGDILSILRICIRFFTACTVLGCGVGSNNAGALQIT